MGLLSSRLCTRGTRKGCSSASTRSRGDTSRSYRGYLSAQTIRSNLVEDRGDGRRGSTQLPDVGKEAVTHVSVESGFRVTLLSCRLETDAPIRFVFTSRKPATRFAATSLCEAANGEVFDDRSEAPDSRCMQRS